MSLNQAIPQNDHIAGSNDFCPRSSTDADLGANQNGDVGAKADLKKIATRLSRHYPECGIDLGRSLFQVITTAIAFFAMLGVMSAVAGQMYWLTLLLAIPTAGLLVRLFIVQHDCGHGSYFKSKASNDTLGRLISVLTLTPYDHWRRSHAAHHATSGNLDRRGQGDVMTITVEEYQELSPLGRLGYRLYRNPLVMILIGAPVNFIILQRIPMGRGARDRDSRNSILALNVAILIAFGIPMAFFGIGKVLTVYLPVMTIAAWIGGWLFYVQHQFEGTTWSRNEEWDFHKASIIGSSYFELPTILRWFTGSIGLHHIHHLCCRIPNYRLQAIHDAFPELSAMAQRINILESIKCWRLALWDESQSRLVSFRDLKRQAAS